MDKWQKDHIEKNLVELIKFTNCNVHLLALLSAEKVLAGHEKELIDSLPTPSEKSIKLYEILQTRVGSFNVLIKSLEETLQSGAVKILKGHRSEYHCHGSIKYDQNSFLGTGCLGTKVHKGTFGGREVAVKVLHSAFISPEVALREVDFLKLLDNHENVIRYFNAETDGTITCIALELCQVSLQDEVKIKLIQLPSPFILRKCTKGLAHLHKLNVVHGDLKPANILLSRPNHVKISDFGISKQIPLGATSVSIGSGVFGTADWMAPEILKALQSECADPKSCKMKMSSDIFSLGCIFYFVLTNGEHPFGEPGDRQFFIRRGQPQFEFEGLDTDWLELIKCLIAHTASDRLTAHDLLKHKLLKPSDTGLSTKADGDKDKQRVDGKDKDVNKSSDVHKITPNDNDKASKSNAFPEQVLPKAAFSGKQDKHVKKRSDVDETSSKDRDKRKSGKSKSIPAQALTKAASTDKEANTQGTPSNTKQDPSLDGGQIKCSENKQTNIKPAKKFEEATTEDSNSSVNNQVEKNKHLKLESGSTFGSKEPKSNLNNARHRSVGSNHTSKSDNYLELHKPQDKKPQSPTPNPKPEKQLCQDLPNDRTSVTSSKLLSKEARDRHEAKIPSTENTHPKPTHLIPEQKPGSNDKLHAVTEVSNSKITDSNKTVTKSKRLYNVPPISSLYVPRSISNRHEVNIDVLKQTCSDVFVFQDIERLKLNEILSSSSETFDIIWKSQSFIYINLQLLKLSRTEQSFSKDNEVKELRKALGRGPYFVELEQDSHWEQIKAVCTHLPVHRIRYEVEPEAYILSESYGTSTVLWNYVGTNIKNTKSYLTEDEFVDNIDTLASGVCICDTPGMGKSWLLASIARKVELKHPNRIVLFVQLADFVKNVHRPLPKIQPNSPDQIYLLLQNAGIDNVAIQSNRFELFFDAFDEIQLDDMAWTKLFLQNIANSHKIYVTSRPYMRRDLETTLGVIAYDILPLTEQDQLNFVVNIWKSPTPDCEETRLHNFGSRCLKLVQESFTADERDIMGIPLMCHLLAELYMNEARQYATSKEDVEPELEKSIAVYDMYKRYAELRLGMRSLLSFQTGTDYSGSSGQNNVLLRLKALQIIFPTLAEEYRLHIKNTCKKIDSTHLMEAPLNPTTSSEFPHQTLAEFVVAEFFTDVLLSPKEDNSEFQKHVKRCFTEKILIRGLSGKKFLRFYRKDSGTSIELSTFSYPVIVYFFNTLLFRLQAQDKRYYKLETFFENPEPTRLYHVLQRCAFHNYLHLFRFLKDMIISAEETKNKPNKYKEFLFTKTIPLRSSNMFPSSTYIKCEVLLICVAASHAGAEMIDEVFQLFETGRNYDLGQACDSLDKDVMTPLHRSISRCDVESVRYLVDRCSLKSRSYIHWCVYDSYNETTEMSARRIEMCKLLLGKEKQYLFNETSYEMTPELKGSIVNWPIHLDVLKYLIDEGIPNINSQGGRILNCAKRYMTYTDYSKFKNFLNAKFG